MSFDAGREEGASAIEKQKEGAELAVVEQAGVFPEGNRLFHRSLGELGNYWVSSTIVESRNSNLSQFGLEGINFSHALESTASEKCVAWQKCPMGLRRVREPIRRLDNWSIVLSISARVDMNLRLVIGSFWAVYV